MFGFFWIASGPNSDYGLAGGGVTPPPCWTALFLLLFLYLWNIPSNTAMSAITYVESEVLVDVRLFAHLALVVYLDTRRCEAVPALLPVEAEDCVVHFVVVSENPLV